MATWIDREIEHRIVLVGDGYTLSLGNTGTHVLDAAFYSLQYDVFNDFTPISPLVRFPFVLFARRTLPAAGAGLVFRR